MLSILGDSQAIPAAVYASSNSGQVVGIHSSALSATELPHTQFNNVQSPVRLQYGVLEDTDLFVVVSESSSLEDVLHKFKTVIAGRNLLLAPGGFAGALRVVAWFKEWGLPVPRVAEVTGLIAVGRREPEGLGFQLGEAKQDLPFASATNDVTQEMLADYAPYFPNLVASDLVTTSLSNSNHMIHPGVVLLNAVRIENGERFRFYREGLSPAACNFLEAIDRERLEVVIALGGRTLKPPRMDAPVLR